jgi:hypothetical protein
MMDLPILGAALVLGAAVMGGAIALVRIVRALWRSR